MLSIGNSSSINLINSEIFSELSQTQKYTLFREEDTFTGQSSASSSLRTSVIENRKNVNSVNAGIGLIETNRNVLYFINTVVEEMLSLAESAADEQFGSIELSNSHREFESYLEDIDKAANVSDLLNKEDGYEQVSIGPGISIGLTTHDLTSFGLDIDNLDIRDNPEEAKSVLEKAREMIAEAAGDLAQDFNSLTTAAEFFAKRSSLLLATKSGIESTDAARMVSQAVISKFPANSDSFLSSQANISSETVKSLINQ